MLLILIMVVASVIAPGPPQPGPGGPPPGPGGSPPGPGDLDAPSDCISQLTPTDCAIAFGVTTAHTFQNCAWNIDEELCVNCSAIGQRQSIACFKDPTLSYQRAIFNCSLFDNLPSQASIGDCDLAYTTSGDRCAADPQAGICRTCSYFSESTCPLQRACIVLEHQCVSKASRCRDPQSCTGECYDVNGMCGFCGDFTTPGTCPFRGCMWDNDTQQCSGTCSRLATPPDCEHDGLCFWNNVTPACQAKLTAQSAAAIAAATSATTVIIIAASAGGGFFILVVVGGILLYIRQRRHVVAVIAEAQPAASTKLPMTTSSRESFTLQMLTNSTGSAVPRRSSVDVAGCRRLKLIGRGANGSVYTCSLSDGSIAAMKEILLPPSTNYATLMDAVQREVDIVSSFDHPNIIRFYGSHFDCEEHRLVIFMELVSHGSLGALVRSMQEPLPEDISRIYAAQIVSAVAYIHAHNVVHRDLKCDNILLTEGGQIKLADFGASKCVEANRTGGAQTLIGTPFFMAPEMLNCGDGPDDGYGRRADVWSLGITLLEMMNRGRVPWPDFPNVNTAILHISSENAHPIVPESFSAELKDFISHCCCRDPLQRYTSAQLLAHPWIAPLLNNQQASSESATV